MDSNIHKLQLYITLNSLRSQFGGKQGCNRCCWGSSLQPMLNLNSHQLNKASKESGLLAYLYIAWEIGQGQTAEQQNRPSVRKAKRPAVLYIRHSLLHQKENSFLSHLYSHVR
ncbi:CLUMA_CG004282, isoform A [Clunio marinus]|uniref:CLUMA_CG004282, isoform A n=1 Tax=Clunio marinus TaxID=568069 RepID=A0A1J1HRH7_9DIPT|nr:CLUMA_CG004282, isoform A [Clunio marinus]